MSASVPSQAPVESKSVRWVLLACFLAAWTSILVLAIWKATDASFEMAAWKAQVASGVKAIQSSDPDMVESLGIADRLRSIQWDPIGKRVLFLKFLFFSGFVATTAVAIFALKYRSRESVVRLGLLLVAWGSLYAAQEEIQAWRARRQVEKLLPRFESIASSLNNKWPDKPGTLPTALAFYVGAQDPDVLLVRGKRPSYPISEDLGLTIRRDARGIIRFDLAADFCSTVECHPDETTPTAIRSGSAAKRSGFGDSSPPVAATILLKDRWYLVRYGTE